MRHFGSGIMYYSALWMLPNATKIRQKIA
jgi:hypothetical protein